MFYNISTDHISQHVESKIHNLMISFDQFKDQKKTNCNRFSINGTTKSHQIQILPVHERLSISKKCVIYRPNFVFTD